ncbi:MAG: ATP-dependent helicase C-terminal domain-containing protein, partial [Oceanobacter sp.]
QSSYQLSQGSGAELNQSTDLHGHDWLAVASLSGGSPNRIQLAAAMTQSDIEQLLELSPWLASETVQIEWQEAGNLKAERQRLIGQLILERQPLTNLSAEDWQSAWKQWFSKQSAHDQREGLFPNLKQLNWTQEAEQLRRRMALVRYYLPEDGWPDVSDTSLIATLDDWLMPYLNQARHLRDLNKINLEQALVSLLDWPQQEALKELAPTHLPVPSGSRIAIDYPADPKHGEPVLAVKLQEMFGCEQQPAILRGRLPLLVHLLSPAKRPLQVTSDLPHFWRNTYAEVRKDMRGRYPKHPWPEDPLSAEATRLTKRALENRK